MAHTLPDYTSKWKTKTISAIADYAELAARLGSINTYDRRGNTIWMDDFEGVELKWTTAVVGANSSVTLNTEKPLSGSQCVKLAVGAGANDYVNLSTQRLITVLGRIGTEFAIKLPVKTDYISYEVKIYDGAKTMTGTVKYSLIDENLKIKIGAVAWQTIASNIKTFTTVPFWNNTKLVVDSNTSKYVRLLWGAKEYDISAYDLVEALSVTAEHISLSITLTNDGANAINAFIDNVILTQNEV